MSGSEFQSVLCLLSCGCKCRTTSTLRKGYVFFAPKAYSLAGPCTSDSFIHLFLICTKGIFKLVVALLKSPLLCLNGSLRSSATSGWCSGSWPHSCWGWAPPKSFPGRDCSPSPQACHPPQRCTWGVGHKVPALGAHNIAGILPSPWGSA